MASDQESTDSPKGDRQAVPSGTAVPRPHPSKVSESGAAQGGKAQDFLTKYMSTFMTAIVVTGLGIYSDHALDKRAKHEAKMASQAQNYRLYTELLSARENAESALRKDMFKAILDEFFAGNSSEGSESSVTKRILKLEMLALNFGESLSLSPLFTELENEILKMNAEPTKKDEYQRRLWSLAKQVAQQQIAALVAGGDPSTMEFFFEDASGNNKYKWPVIEELDCGGGTIKREFSITFSDAIESNKDISVQLKIITQGGKENEIEKSFTLNFFNFPMVDNTRLSHDQRFALILTNFEEGIIEVKGICFPGKYAGQRDKPFLDDVIHRLDLKNEAEQQSEIETGAPANNAP